MGRLEILQRSLEKKEAELRRRFDVHFADVRSANGQPLNDKRNGQATLNRWERQNESIRNQKANIERTQRAIEIEQGKIAGVEHANSYLPSEILALVEAGTLQQWRKHPHTFFVSGVEKARIVWLEKRKLIAHKYSNQIPTQEQRSKFVKIFNDLHSQLNGNR